MHHHHQRPTTVTVSGNNGNFGDISTLHRQHHHHHHHHQHQQTAHHGTSEPESAGGGSLRKHIAASLMQHHRAIARSNRAPQPLSPPSYASSMEVTPYDPAVTPSTSLEFKGRARGSHYTLKTSTELLKVLNRLWSLEEQHGSNMSLIKALKTELEHARLKIKELTRDQKADRHEINDLMKQMAEDKLVRRNNNQDRLHAAIQSLRDELEDERKLRKRSESLHRKLARELSEVKSSFSISFKEMERERKSRQLLEGLCGEFAKRIKDYEQEVHVLKQNTDKDWTGRDDHDRLILQISESWLDECMQMKQEEAQTGVLERNSIMDKLGFEIENFLQAKKTSSSKITDTVLPRNRWNSLESVPLNDAYSAPQQEDSGTSDQNCFELNKLINIGDETLLEDKNFDGFNDETVKSNQAEKKLVSREKVRGRIPSNRQVKFEEEMAWAMSRNGNNNCGVVENCQAIENEGKNKVVDETHVSNQNHMIENLLRNHISEIRLENNGDEASCSYPVRKNTASPIRRWITKLTVPDLDIPESSTKQNPGTKENTLKAKLLEARSSKGRRLRSKNFRGSL
ncbi:hypothetical protein ACFE04_023411 [Oxalis oulophora]